MKLGNDTVGLRKLVPRVDGDGKAVHDDFGDPVVDVVDVEVRWSLVTPTTRQTSDTNEPQDRTAPALSGMTWLAPPRTPVDEADVAVWPITGRETVDEQLRLTGDTWQIDGEPAPWGDALEVHLQRAT